MVPVINFMQTSCRLIRRLHSMIFAPADPVIMGSDSGSKPIQFGQSKPGPKSPKRSNLYFLDSPNDGPKRGISPFRGIPAFGPSVFGLERLDRWLSRKAWVWRYRWGECHMIAGTILGWRIMPAIDRGEGAPGFIMLGGSSLNLNKEQCTDAITLAFSIGDDPASQGLKAGPVRWCQSVCGARWLVEEIAS